MIKANTQNKPAPAAPNSTAAPFANIARAALIAITAALIARPAPAAPEPPRQQHKPGKQYRSPYEGPWNHDLVILESTDCLTFKGKHIAIERAGVPSVAADKNGRAILVFQWFPYYDQDAFDKVAVSFSNDDGLTWTDPRPIRVKGLPEKYMRPFDPAIVTLPDGSYRLYFTSRETPRSDPAIYSAISADAINYTFEPGVRSSGAGAGVVDSSAIYWRGQWHLYAHEFIDPKTNNTDNTYSERAYHAVSADGLNFKPLKRINVPARSSWIGNPLIIKGRLFFYGTGEANWPATSSDGSDWRYQPQTSARAADPAVFIASDNTCRMIATGPLRDDASDPPFSPPTQKRRPKQ